jgi:mannose-1-phosphate guanylyltransferase/mannose-6-phosphate isomerase
MKLLPVIMSGGSGTRLWPISRSKFPKQFANFLGDTLHTLTLRRLKKYGSPVIITSENFRDLTELELRKNAVSARKVLYEPEPKNTAAAMALCCRYLELENSQDEIVGVFSSDNIINDEVSFHQVLEVAARTAQNDFVVVLGIKPSRAETGFGYIQVEDRAIGTGSATQVQQFHEKPSPERAEEFLSSGDFFWNAGIFVFKVRHMIGLFKRFEPELWATVSELKNDFSNLKEIFSQLKSISIDYAILEKLNSKDLRCITCDIGWSDLGSWDVMLETRKDAGVSPSDTLEIQARGNLFYTQKNKTYAIAAADDLMVVDSADALLICKRGESQLVKEVVERLKKISPARTKDHVFENRPWGQFEILRDESYYKSKILRADPGQRLSYQSHAKRSEHWIVVKGEPTVVLNDKEIKMKPGEHIHIPQGAKHRLINSTSDVVEWIEVQTGTYFGEDDIQRYQDDYGRNN